MTTRVRVACPRCQAEAGQPCEGLVLPFVHMLRAIEAAIEQKDRSMNRSMNEAGA